MPDRADDGPAWAEGFAFGADEIELQVVYRPESFDDAEKFMSVIGGFGAEVFDVKRA